MGITSCDFSELRSKQKRFLKAQKGNWRTSGREDVKTRGGSRGRPLGTGRTKGSVLHPALRDDGRHRAANARSSGSGNQPEFGVTWPAGQCGCCACRRRVTRQDVNSEGRGYRGAGGDRGNGPGEGLGVAQHSAEEGRENRLTRGGAAVLRQLASEKSGGTGPSACSAPADRESTLEVSWQVVTPPKASEKIPEQCSPRDWGTFGRRPSLLRKGTWKPCLESMTQRPLSGTVPQRPWMMGAGPYEKKPCIGGKGQDGRGRAGPGYRGATACEVSWSVHPGESLQVPGERSTPGADPGCRARFSREAPQNSHWVRGRRGQWAGRRGE